MRLLQLDDEGKLSLTRDLTENIPPYSILSHTWGNDDDEVTFKDLENGLYHGKAGYGKITFCAERARRDGILHFWVDTCCIDKSSHTEVSEAITSMFRWYRRAIKCHVYLSDVSALSCQDDDPSKLAWEQDFRKSKWFTRGWTLQELLAPEVVEFYTYEGQLLGDKKTLTRLIHEITEIPIDALRSTALSQFPRKERMRWAARRETKKPEDKAYCLLGIFDVFMPLIYGEADNAFLRLEKSIAERYGSTMDAAHEHWLVPRSAQPLFTGRKTLLHDLETVIRKAVYTSHLDEPCRIVISGLGGQGKSEICLQLAHRLRHIFWAVLWIDISTTEMAERSFLEIAQNLSRPVQTWQQGRSVIANLKHPWLLVLDNADSPDIDYLQYLPDSSVGIILMTTRNEECQQYATTPFIDLTGLDEGDSCELLLKACRINVKLSDQHRNDARKVANLLQSHALALLQAGAYIARGHCTLATYPQIYHQQRQRLMQFRPRQAQSHYQDVYATFEVSARMLQTMYVDAAADALQLLSILAACGSSPVPLSILFESAHREAKLASQSPAGDSSREAVSSLMQWHSSQVPLLDNVNSKDYNRYRLVEAISLLKTLSLLSCELSDKSLLVSFHPLVHAWLWDRQSDAEQYQSWLRFASLLALRVATGMPASRNIMLLQNHVETVVEYVVKDPSAIELTASIVHILIYCGWYLQYVRADVKLHKLIQTMFHSLSLELHEVKQTHINLYDLAARNSQQCGKINQSVFMLEQIVKVREKFQANDDLALLRSQHELACAYIRSGQAKAAVALLKRIRTIRDPLLSEDHPDRLASQYELASAYLADKQVIQAIALFENGAQTVERYFAEDHPLRLSSQHELARAYLANHQAEKAVLLLEKVVDVGARLSAEDHPDHVMSQHELATAYSMNGQLQKALVLMEKVVKIWAQSLAEDHPSRLRSQHTLAIFLRDSGQHERALAILREIVPISRRTFDEGHPSRQNCERSLEHLERKLAQLSLADSTQGQ